MMNAALERDTLPFEWSPCGDEYVQTPFEPGYAVYGALPLAVLITALTIFQAARSAPIGEIDVSGQA